MSKILFLNGSPIPTNNSKSFALVTKFIEEYKLINPNDEIIKRDLNEIKLTNLNSSNMANFFDQSDEFINELLSVDKIIINVPMINFGLPTIVKQWFDLVCVANKTFTYKYVKETRETGLVKNIKNAMIINTMGGTTEKYNFANVATTVKDLFAFLGIKNTNIIQVQGMKMDPRSSQSTEDLLKEFDSQIKAEAKKF
ncbi:FMN-dependent NADH-azoreductase [Spiroplasma sp. TIUS-1]|uniref:FMN-dependent NADH-azoreductase n=1 Tax=Spiroplasma sp. TIUS-1 TaxID=216963 RepID=UPI001397EEA1|nr:FMN-dependent NADH-azoreductase [Spiroplasma sp. TIUS-1]QHX35894.1 FMN-dependent NADH-azoreductase [Spiroplasma sp. TIUS-1]